MNQNFRAGRALGYAQAAAGAFDAAALASAVVTIPLGASEVLIICEAQAIRWRDDGTAPTTTVGMPLAVAVEKVYTADSLAKLRIISQTAGAIVNFVFYG